MKGARRHFENREDIERRRKVRINACESLGLPPAHTGGCKNTMKKISDPRQKREKKGDMGF